MFTSFKMIIQSCIYRIPTSAKIDEIMIIFGVKIDCDNAIMFNYCLIMAKHFIYINRLNNHNSFDLYNFLIFLKNKMSIEYEYYNSKGLKYFQ